MSSLSFDKDIEGLPKRGFKRLPKFFGVGGEGEPKYYVIKSIGNFQIRKYQSMLVAETWVNGSFEEAYRRAFQRLGQFIFGHNDIKQELRMTVPLFVARGEKMHMTTFKHAEVIHEGWIMAYVMPSGFRLENVPRPMTKNIKVVEIPPMIVAVLKYKGRNTEEKILERMLELNEWIKQQDDCVPISEARCAQYDGPFVIPYFRRNEIQITLNLIPSKKKRHSFS